MLVEVTGRERAGLSRGHSLIASRAQQRSQLGCEQGSVEMKCEQGSVEIKCEQELVEVKCRKLA